MALKVPSSHIWLIQTEQWYYYQTALQEGNSAELHYWLQAGRGHQEDLSGQVDIEHHREA